MKLGNLGSKYQNSDGVIFRSIKMKNENTVSLKNLSTGEIKNVDTDYVLNSLVKLTPDAILNIMLCEDDVNGSKYEDVYVVVYRTATIESGNTEPDLILRQDVYSYTKNNPFTAFGNTNIIYVGDCITKFTMPGDGFKMMDLFEYNKVKVNHSFDLYSDDKLSDIMELIGNKAKIYNATLENIYNEKAADNIKGYCRNLKELCKDNHFIEAYRSLFNITTIDWNVVLGKQSFNEDGDIILNSKQIKAVENIVRKYITDVKVIEYGYDVDISKIVRYSHIMVSDINEKIYLIAYRVIGDYPVDDDIAKAMGVPQPQ